MNAIVFEKDGQTVWPINTADGKEIFSVCVEVNSETLDLQTLFVREEKSMVWLKANSEATAINQQKAVITAVNKGILTPYREFSKTAFYDGQEEDINPTTEEKLGRYSQVKLCPADKHAELHRQYVVPTVVAVDAPVAPPVEAQTPLNI